MWESETTVRKYYCESCDKSFRTEDDLIIHEAEHETCGREGCEFTAHPKIIAKHKRMQHDSGLYKRIGKLYTDEDIAKWIEERKKRYPSMKVIEEKKALEEEKMKRGERIKDDDSKFNKAFQKNNRKSKVFEKKTLKTQKNRRSRKKRNSGTVLQNLEGEGEQEEMPSIRKGVPAFIGIKKAFEPEKPIEPEKEEDFDISDEEWEGSTKAESLGEPLLNNSLGLLATSYGSDDDTVDRGKDGKDTEGEGSGPEEVRTVSSKNPLPSEQSERKKIFTKRKLGRGKEVAGGSKKIKIESESSGCRNLTLLEKLLRTEIRHERNVILQCVHYFVKNNFFNT